MECTWFDYIGLILHIGRQFVKVKVHPTGTLVVPTLLKFSTLIKCTRYQLGYTASI